nr:amino acid permease [Kineococcus rubinsiae]
MHPTGPAGAADVPAALEAAEGATTGVAGGELRREFTLWSAFAFAFAFISPIVALYGIFSLAITTAGPSFWWNFFLVFGGQFLVALVFAELVSRWPLEGSVYQWSRRLVGPRYGWFAGWAYAWTLVIAMVTVCLGAAGFVANIAGRNGAGAGTLVTIAVVILALGTVANLIGRRVLKILMTASIVAEIIGSVGLGLWLLVFHREQSFSVLFDGAGSGPSAGQAVTTAPFLLAMAFVGFSFVGFESAGNIAEEVREPHRNLPRAVLASLTLVAAVVLVASLGIILAIPDLGAATSGSDADPVYSTLVHQLGVGMTTPIEVLFVIGFLASFLALQTAASRVVWAYARDRALPGHRHLARLSEGQRLPVTAIVVTSLVGLVILLCSTVATDVYASMISFSAGGFYVAFLFPVLGSLWARRRGTWRPGVWTLGRWALPIGIAAAVWTVFQFLNIAWPRALAEQRWMDFSFWIVLGVLLVVGAVLVPRRPGTGPDEVSPPLPADEPAPPAGQA